MSIVSNQKNLKVHFAGAEQVQYTDMISTTQNINYHLFTVFPLICSNFGIKSFKPPVPVNKVGRIVQELSRHCIMDSGLFTLMFGSHKGNKDAGFIDKWYKELVNYVLQNGYNGTCVEVDCQKVLGVEKAWYYREMMKKDLPNNRQINVFHLEDGQKGLDRLIEFSDYIALSVPELRACGKKDYLVRLTNYVKNKKPSIDIHLLGMTEKKLLAQLNFASSADSTSWLSPMKYGVIGCSDVGRYNINNTNLDTLSEFKKDAEEILEKYNLKVNDSKLLYLCRGSLSAKVLKKIYTKYAGNQD